MLACGLACALAASVSARADGFHTIPRLVPAVDLNTGGPYYAPPIPGGHYTGKDIPGKVHGKIAGLLHGGLLGGHHGKGKGHGHGDGGCGDPGCSTCGGGAGLGHGHGSLFGGHHGNGGGCGTPGCGDPGCGLGNGGGLFHKKGHGHGHATTIVASDQGAPTPQAAPVFATAQCGDPGCGHLGRLHHHKGCGLCGGKGCGGCAVSDPCGTCGDKACGGKGCGHGLGGLCKLCGGAGCSACAKARGLVSHLLGHDKIKWFNGPGGPVPLTPGYTPYINVTRSPRDFFAFPPMTP
jgi:hypothetical protein